METPEQPGTWNNEARNRIRLASSCLGVFLLLPVLASLHARAEEAAPPLRVGIIGTDTSHAVRFTELLNDAGNPDRIAGARIVAAFKGGSPDIPASADRVEGFAEELRAKHGVEIVPSIDALLPKVDAVLLLSVDGRVHLEQARPVFAAKKRLFIDKPLAAGLKDARELARLSAESGVPFFSASALRFCASVRGVKDDPALGGVVGCDARSPAMTEPHHPDLFWYGVHGVEILYTFMGPGCARVRCVHTDGVDVVTARWTDGRVATLRGTREGPADFGAIVHGRKAVRTTPPPEKALYRNLVAEIVRFFRGGDPPVPVGEMLEELAFMEAADRSRRGGGGEKDLEAIAAGAGETPKAAGTAPDVLPGTHRLTIEGDPAAQMVAGIDAYLMRELAAAPGRRADAWTGLDRSSPEAWAKSAESLRERLRKIIGTVDPRRPVDAFEYVASTAVPSLVARGQGYEVHAVRWPVFDGVDGEGLLLRPEREPLARVVAIPDADATPEQLAGLAPGVAPEAQFARRLAEGGCEVLVPSLIDRAEAGAVGPSGRGTNQPRREFVYRAAYEMGRHVIGYEVQKILAAVDVFARETPADRAVGVFGHGEGGLIAIHAAALDSRIAAAVVSGCFEGREEVWHEPIYRNVWSQLPALDDAGIAALIAPRRLIVEAARGSEIPGPPPAREGRSGAAPGRLRTPPIESVRRAFAQAAAMYDTAKAPGRCELVLSGDGSGPPGSEPALIAFRAALGVSAMQPPPGPVPADPRKGSDPEARRQRQFDQLNEFTQRVVRRSEADRAKYFWSKIDMSSPEKLAESTKPLRASFRDEVIGNLPPPSLPANPRTRKVYDEPKWTGYDVMLDLYPDVFAYGVLLLPKDLKPGERRPVVVCQHGLEGRPQHTINEKKDDGYHYYKAFARRLAERGFVVYAPQNPYIGGDAFRVLQRKANPLGLSLFSFVVRQHERTLDWLAEQPFVDPKRIGFYGLSYGGKTAMRVPALLDRYALSICSGDFNEWIWKNTSLTFPASYLFTNEYEMPEFDLGGTFNYAEMAALIAPRPFMVERGHDDAVGLDEQVAYEYAKVRRLYDKLGIGDRTAMEVFNGPHTIHGRGTFQFLEQHLGWPENPQNPNPKSQ